MKISFYLYSSPAVCLLCPCWKNFIEESWYVYKIPDPDRPKNDKATILADTIQMLKDLMAQVNKLKSEYEALSEESSEVNYSPQECSIMQASSCGVPALVDLAIVSPRSWPRRRMNSEKRRLQ